MGDLVKVSVEGGVHWITLNRPDVMNALNRDLRRDLTAGPLVDRRTQDRLEEGVVLWTLFDLHATDHAEVTHVAARAIAAHIRITLSPLGRTLCCAAVL